MARIPEEEIERLKAEVAVERLAEARGIALRRHGKDLLGLCPFHDDREPSLVISPAKNLWHCMGACSAGGSVIDWVMRAEGVSFRHAVELLRQGAPTSSDGPAPKRTSVRKLTAPFDVSAEDRELLGEVVGFYHQTLRESPEAIGFLERRRIAHSEAVERFRLGYANRTLGYRLPDKNRAAGADIRGRLQRLGVYRTSGHEHFAGSLVIPVINDGIVREVYGRKVGDKLRAGTPLHLYLPGPHAGVFNVEAFAASDEIIVCESLIDALSFWCAGFRHVTAAYGTEGVTAELLDALRANDVRRVLIAFDADDAGDRAAKKLAKSLLADGIECFRITFAAGADANDVVRDAKNPTDVLGRLIRTAAWLGAGPAPNRRSTVTAVEASVVDEDQGEPDVDEHGAEPDPSFAAGPLPPELVSPTPALPDDVAPVVDGDELRVALGDRRWRVRGLSKVSSFDLLRVNVLVARHDGRGDRFHVDTLDLYSARARTVFVKQAADELHAGEDVIKHGLGRVLLACERVADEVVRSAQAPSEQPVVLSEAEQAAALELLRAPDLINRVIADFERVGIVGEATNCLVGYLAAVSRMLDRPLAVIVQSTSAAGKSALMDAVLAFVPGEERVKFSAMTGQSLFYMGEADLAHKVLAVAEEEGAERAAYALKLLQSEGELSIASTGKDTTSGRLVTHTYSVKGPTAILLTTTAVDVDEELLNRCIVLSVDEDRDQTRAIHDRQRRAQTLDGLLASQARDEVVKVHQDAQRLLAPVLVVNPFAEQLSFADGRTRTRRDHPKYLTLIRAIALLHQHQRERKTITRDGRVVSFIEVEPADVALANRLAAEVLGRSLDELPPGTRRLLDALDAHVVERAASDGIDRAMVRFSRRELREHLGWGDTQLKVHLARLVDLELVMAHRAEHGPGFVYELAWAGEGADGSRFVIGLTDPNTLAYDPDRSGSNNGRSAPGRGSVGGLSARGRAAVDEVKAQANGHNHVTDDTSGAERAAPGDDEHDVVVEARAG
ncbi:MAG TPA: CHC2 zinc finger domain-containing protein [Acidimicrobiales bacterium]|nr:CHC2 zinc finger domain-containing protein [Acidimicrobiales bacterium]